ncbi:phenylalanine--tRNA ligase subunit alpha [Candidatus Synchoanobacter obligatus]|uniref:Phenylalanine--tRNA ligase alpha subunit n=1 Tax=Candidatus Synchoanobacter obligatus TaxID=2919597 RepID=A0ABT1L4Q0_9GAMM|nr:phenylalanine--tRNA ligase subunit alpha [Candidatus Synchoanobacter obligatus]MCP8351705.1 phenylalanine--tRNA ligase subunit alpha [Candidatus Synchoanobacter obligatus]
MDASVKACQSALADLEANDKLIAHEVDQLKSFYLGKKSQISQQYQSLAKLPPEDKKSQGKALNDVRMALNALIQEGYARAEKIAVNKLLGKGVDITAASKVRKPGSLHPLTIAYQEMVAILQTMGFVIESGPHIEDDYHNFTALNFPEDHPARTMHDTFYLKDSERLLRTHTSTVQVHILNRQEPPLRIATPGRVYRCDHDPTHSPMFNQLECLVVEPGCNFSQLKWLLLKFCEAYLGKPLDYRFRPSFFPFTEPSAELDIVWGDKWLELAGCGMVHPNVLSEAGIDTETFQGFAFGIGIDRLAMMKYGINDLRVLYENHVEFLEQF